MSARRAGLLSALLATAALLCALPGLWRGAMQADPNRMDERLRPPRARTLTVWLLPGNVEDRKLLNEACAAFEKEGGGVRVFLRTVDAQELLAPDAVLPDVALLASGSLTEPERALLPLGGEGEMDASGKSGGVCYAMPLWLAHALSEFGVCPTTFSKYGRCYEMLLQKERMRRRASSQRRRRIRSLARPNRPRRMK